jgi:membrane associated rhomboid family serine protease
MPRFPILTAIAVTVAVAAAVMQYAVPAVVPALQRDTDALLQGQWWRLGSPLLVQTLGWHQVVANLLTLAVFGLVAEWLLGRWRWWVLLAAGTIGGQLAAYAMREPGGGSSIAICGLAGGVAAAVLAGRGPAPPWFSQAVVLYVALLAGWGFGGAVTAGVAGAGCAVALYGLHWADVRAAERFALAGAVLVATAMAAARDLHGVSFLSGVAAMVAVIAAERVARA